MKFKSVEEFNRQLIITTIIIIITIIHGDQDTDEEFNNSQKGKYDTFFLKI